MQFAVDRGSSNNKQYLHAWEAGFLLRSFPAGYVAAVLCTLLSLSLSFISGILYLFISLSLSPYLFPSPFHSLLSLSFRMSWKEGNRNG